MDILICDSLETNVISFQLLRGLFEIIFFIFALSKAFGL